MAYDTDEDELPLTQIDPRESLTGMTIPVSYGSAAGAMPSPHDSPYVAKPEDSSITGMPAAGTEETPQQSVTAGPLGGTRPLAERPAAARYQSLEAMPSPVSQRHGFTGALKNVADVLGSAMFPAVAQYVPGSSANRSVQLEQAQKAAQEEGLTIQEQEAEREAQSREALQAAQAKEAEQTGNARQAGMENVTIIGNNGVAYSVPRKDAERLMGVIQTQAGANERQGEKDQTNLEIFGGKGQAITLQLPNGQKVAGKKTPKGDLLLANNQPVPPGTLIYQQPNYGSQVLPTKTTTVLDENGIPTVMGWNEKTQRYDIPQGTSAAGSYGHEASQAGIVQRGGETLIADIQANRDKLGDLEAWVKKYGLNTPIADPDLAGLQAELGTFAALQPAMHGFRSASAMEAFEKIIGGLQKNPDATIASIRGILKTAGAINPKMQQEPPRPANVPASYTFKQNGPKGPGWYK